MTDLEQISDDTVESKPWWITAQPQLRLRDRIRLLVGVPLIVRFSSPDGQCHAACSLSVGVQRGWPANDGQALTSWPR